MSLKMFFTKRSFMPAQLVFFAVACLVFGSPHSRAETENTGENKQDPDVQEIVRRANYVSYYQGRTGRAKVRMQIVGADGQKRNREFIMLRWDRPRPDNVKKAPGYVLSENDEYMGAQRFYVYFQRPSDWAKTVFLVHKYLDKPDNRWLYQPALDLVNRISAADKRNSFVGSHFFYEDVSGRQLDLDKHELVNTTDRYYVLKHTPKDPKYVEFDYYKMWIHKDSYVVVQTRYYNEQGREYRRQVTLNVEDIQGYKTVTKQKMVDLSDGSYTVMRYDDVNYDVDINKDIFEKRYLKNPPLKYLK